MKINAELFVVLLWGRFCIGRWEFGYDFSEVIHTSVSNIGKDIQMRSYYIDAWVTDNTFACNFFHHFCQFLAIKLPLKYILLIQKSPKCISHYFLTLWLCEFIIVYQILQVCTRIYDNRLMYIILFWLIHIFFGI